MRVIWGRDNSVNVQKVLWCCEELGIEYKRVDAGMNFGVVNTPEYRALNPNSLVPTLDEDGFVLWESTTSGDDAWPFLTPIGPVQLPNHQHSVRVLADGHLAIYDNGNTRPPPEKRSRAVEYVIDGANLTVSQVWDWFDPDYSPSLLNVIGGDASPQPNGTVVVANSGQRPPCAIVPGLGSSG